MSTEPPFDSTGRCVRHGRLDCPPCEAEPTDWPTLARELLDGDTDALRARLPDWLREDTADG